MRWSHLPLLLAVLHHALGATALPAPQGILDKLTKPRRNSAPGPGPHHTGPSVSYTYQINNHYHLYPPAAPPPPPPPPPVVYVPHPAVVVPQNILAPVPHTARVAPHPAVAAAYMQAHAQAQAHAEAHDRAQAAAQARAMRNMHVESVRAQREHEQWQREQARIFAENAHAQEQARYLPRPYVPVTHGVSPYPPLMGNSRYAATATGYPAGPGLYSSSARHDTARRPSSPASFDTAPRYAEPPARSVRPVRRPTLAIMPPPPGSRQHSDAHSSTRGGSRTESHRPPSILSDFSIPPAIGQRPIAKYKPELSPEPEEWDHEEGPSSRPSRSGGHRSRHSDKRGKRKY